MATKLNTLLFIALLAATLHGSTAQTTRVVGDALGWLVPPGSVTYTAWASRQTFTVGDVLVFNFTTGQHDVAEVSSAAFDACNTTSPISMSTDGPTNITLRTAGAHFYICTIGRHCSFGQKLAINVSAAPSATPPAATPQPSPSPPISALTPSPMAAAPSPMAATPAPSPSRTPQTYVVGDATGWVVPPGGPTVYQTWASNKNFLVGDILVFNFRNGAHNVAQMASKTAYDSCNTSATSTPITSSPARITLTRSGEHFFICTVPQHCSSGQKLAINVTGSSATPPSSSPTNPPSSGSPSPSSGTPPSGSVVPPPPSPTTPSPPDVSTPPPPNSAPSFAGTALPITLLSIALAFLY